MFTLIENLDDLNFLNLELMNKSIIGVDTEFRRTSKTNMRLSLMQLNDGEETYIIDCVLINNPRDSCNFLFSKEVIKIFHSCKEDIEAINKWTNKGKDLINLYDTQLANAFLGGSLSAGYQDLVLEILDVMVDKKETRSNWMKRPLRDSQLAYAASDVEFLLELYKAQIQKLEVQQKKSWIQEELDFLVSGLTGETNESPKLSLKHKITKQEKNSLLRECNKIVLKIANVSDLNPTLLFSKRLQKEFFELALCSGVNGASTLLTEWRKELLFLPLSKLFFKYGFTD
tara:strand:+ start:29 stop:886 length:858 start_codon:yes stop_codon:yes gene_type:complete